jgi:hypothetical protein
MTLVSFVGLADIRLAQEERGPIVTAVRELCPDRVVMFATEGGVQHDFTRGAAAVRLAIKSVSPETKVQTLTFEIDDPTDHNELYPKLQQALSSVMTINEEVVAAISSGTPSMQVCWILLAESGDAKIRLVRTVEPELSASIVREVRLGTSLPRITSMEQELRNLRDLVIEPVLLERKSGKVMIGGTQVAFSPLQFAYYRFFLEHLKKARKGEPFEIRISAFALGETYTKEINSHQMEAFPDFENSDPTRLAKKRSDISAEDFRSTISKLNKRINDALGGDQLSTYYHIKAEGPKNARRYAIRLDPTKIVLR